MLPNIVSKKSIRNQIFTIRSSLSTDYVTKTEGERKNFVIDFINKQISHSSLRKKKQINIMSYMSFKNEFPTSMINRTLILNYKHLILPYTKKDFTIQPYFISSTDNLKISNMGISEPDIDVCKPADISDIDIVIIPGVAFDRAGSRIGFGKGCYDKLLSNANDDIILIALAYDFQVFEEIPHESNDVPCSFIITETELIECR